MPRRNAQAGAGAQHRWRRHQGAWWRSRPDASTPWARTSSTTASTTSWSTAPRRSRSWTTSRARGSTVEQIAGLVEGIARGLPGARHGARRRRDGADAGAVPAGHLRSGGHDHRRGRGGRGAARRRRRAGRRAARATRRPGSTPTATRWPARIVFDRMKPRPRRPARARPASSVADALLAVHQSYAASVRPVLGRVHALAHITGGGIPGNLVRVLPADCEAIVDPSSWAAAAALRRAAAGRAGSPPTRCARCSTSASGSSPCCRRTPWPLRRRRPARPASRPGRWARSAEAARPCGSPVPDRAAVMRGP